MNNQMNQTQDVRTTPVRVRATGLQTNTMQAVFFFDGEFRTWPQVEQRAQINRAIANQIGKGVHKFSLW